MAGTLTMCRARGDDIPLLLAQLERMGGNRAWTNTFPPMATGWASALVG